MSMKEVEKLLLHSVQYLNAVIMQPKKALNSKEV